MTGTFQTDSDISKFNGEITGEKVLQPWEGPSTCNGEEFDLESGENSTVVSFFNEIIRKII